MAYFPDYIVLCLSIPCTCPYHTSLTSNLIVEVSWQPRTLMMLSKLFR